MVCANSGIEIAKEDKFVTSGDRLDQYVQVAIEFFLEFFTACHGGCIGTDDSLLFLV